MLRMPRIGRAIADAKTKPFSNLPSVAFVSLSLLVGAMTLGYVSEVWLVGWLVIESWSWVGSLW